MQDLDYIKEMFKMFTTQTESLGGHYSRLQSQADRGLLDEQFMRVIPHTDLADLFDEFYDINLVDESSSKSELTHQALLNSIDIIGRGIHSRLTKSTKLKLMEMNDRGVWSDITISVIDGIFNSDVFKRYFHKVNPNREGDPSIENEDDLDAFWFWVSMACVNAVIAVHFRVMSKTSIRTLHAQQSRNIGEVLVGSLGLSWSDKAYEILGTIAQTAVILGDLPVNTELDLDSVLGTTLPKGENFSGVIVAAERAASSFIDEENFPKEPCVTMSSFYYSEDGEKEQYNDTSETIVGLYSVFSIVTEIYPKVGTKEWMDSNGHSMSGD